MTTPVTPTPGRDSAFGTRGPAGRMGPSPDVPGPDVPATSSPVPRPSSLLPAPDRHDGFFLWGAPKAGKSGFIGALYGLSRADEGERWTAHPKDCDDPHTQEMVLRAFEELCERRNTKTGVRDTAYRPLRLTLRKMKGGRQVGELRVALVDPAGEFSVDPAHRMSFAGKELYRQVAASHGVLWLFEATPDGAASTLDRLLILEQLVALLEAAGAPQLGFPVALCLSKIDCLSEGRRRAAVANPTQALLDHLGATSLTWFEAVCPTLHCFAISSAGVVPERVRPIGLNEVLDWLESERLRRLREVKADALRARAIGLVRRWSGRIAKGMATLAVMAAMVYGGLQVARGQGTANGAASKEQAARSTESPSRSVMTATFDSALAARRTGENAQPLFRRAHAHASHLIDRAPPGSRAQALERLVRARACVLGGLGCRRTSVSEDLTWVLLQGDAAQRRIAVRMLERLGG